MLIIKEQLIVTLGFLKSSKFNYNSNGTLQSETLGLRSGKPLTTSYEYDNFGNKVKTIISASDIEDRITASHYSSDGKNLIKVTNALEHSETKTYDNLGRMISLVGPNGLTTQWEYDVLGRKSKEIRADGSITTIKYQWAVGEILNSIYKVTTTSSGNSPVITYYDAFNREVKKQTRGFDGSVVNIDTQYNALGRVSKKSMSYFQDGEVFFATNEYDVRGRVVKTTSPSNNGGNKVITTIYDGLSTTAIDAIGKSKTTIKNAMDEVIEEENAYLKHYHDVFGNLIKTDANGIVTTISYDARGNKQSMDDPSMGIWNYTYNSLDELISQKNAKGQIVSMQYDKLGRMIKRYEPEGITTWEYDTKPQGVGKLAKTIAPNIVKEYVYDDLGRTKEAITRLNGEEYKVVNNYDQYSRLKTQILPGDFITENVYNDNGFVSSIRVPKEQIGDYDFRHLQNLLTANLVKVEEALNKASYYESKALQYQKQVDLYRLLADVYAIKKGRASAIVSEINNAANKIEAVANRLNQEAANYTQISEAFIIMANRFMHLSAMNVPSNQERSYTDTTGPKNRWNITWYIPNREILGTSKSNGYAMCKSKRWCDVLSWYSNYYSRIYTNLANQKINEANAFIAGNTNTQQAKIASVVAKYQAQMNNYDALNIFYTNKLNIAITNAEEAVNNAKMWRIAAQGALKEDNREHYQEMINDDNHIYFYKVKSIDSARRITGFLHGNGLSTENTYNPATGNLQTIKSGFSYDNEIRDYEYNYDDNNNVTDRVNHTANINEYFVYDGLNRLSSMHNSNNGLVNYSYDTKGNLLSNQNSTNHYNGYQITTSNTSGSGNTNTTLQYTYDANGNMTKSGNKIIEYTSFNKPKAFKKEDGSQTTNFLYDENRNRYNKIQNTYQNGVHSQIRTTYIGKLYEKIVDSNTITHKYFIYDTNGKLITIHSKEENKNPFDVESNTTEEVTNCLHYDNLGSVDTITDGNGNVVEQSYYTPFGNKTTQTTENHTLTNRGYTGHEHINEFGFIHMNGRVYDPSIGRFLSPDPHVQFEYNSQSYNRYAYTLNNPLKYTDPSGYFIQFIIPFISAFATELALTYVSTHFLIQATVAYVVNYAITYVTTGSAKAARSAGLAAGLNTGIGAYRTTTGANGQTMFKEGWGQGEWRTVTAHGLASSAVHAYNGGNAGVGFISGTINSYYGTTPGNGKGLIENTFTNAILGGATTALGGGKFANGAQSGAFRYLFNESMEHAYKYITTSSEEFNKNKWEQRGGNYFDKNKVITVDATKIAVELSSTALLPTYQQRISITSYPLDKNGDTYPMMAKSGYFHAGEQSYMTGSSVSRIIIYQGRNSNSRWWVSEPRQIHEHGGVNHSWFNVYVPK